MNPFAIVAALMVFMFVMGLIGSQDLKEEEARIELYCEMTESGAWGSYDTTINCNDGRNNERQSK